MSVGHRLFTVCLAPRQCCDEAFRIGRGDAHIAQLAGKAAESLPAWFREGKGRFLVTLLTRSGFPAAANPTGKFSD